MKRLENAVREILEAALADRGVTLTQYTLLSMVSDVDGMSSADVARRSSVTKQATNEIINALERKALISRSADAENRRILRIKLTRAGRTVLRSCDLAVDRSERRFLAKISATRLAGLRRTIEILID
ncbi:MAG TPA: MarR family transcriptional regulator [Candidatus Lustribacter sp.]|nr:MarR family transcriptional regulator [Candidatus Lustribacter sp.]